MRWTTDRLARLVALLLLITACTTGPSTSPTPMPTLVSSSPPPSQRTSAAPSTTGELEPGQPYDAADILEAMRTSPRPGGVPADVQTDAIATAIAAAIWTLDGEAWDTILISASCGDPTCQVEVAGARDGADGDDLWTFTADPSDGSVQVDAAELRAIPEDLVEQLDLLARSLLDEADVEGMRLTATTWEPPPDGDRFDLSYRSGGEEGSCGLDVAIDPRQREIVDQRTVGGC